MYMKFTIRPSEPEPPVVFFESMTQRGAEGFKEGLVSTGAYTEDQITFSRLDSDWRLVNA